MLYNTCVKRVECIRKSIIKECACKRMIWGGNVRIYILTYYDNDFGIHR